MITQQELADRAGITRSSMGVHISNMMKKGLIAGKGYVLPPAAYAAVVGGVNVDIGGVSYAPLAAGDSNPGRVRVSLGGVGRNIAHNMALLGLDARLLTVLGEDDHAARISASCAELGIDLSRSLRLPGAATSTYLFIAGPGGDMAVAVSDMDVYDRLTPEVLSERKAWLDRARVVVVDANVPAESIAWLCAHVTAPIFADPVSAAKAGRLQPVLGALHTLKPNRLEAERLSGVAITDERSLNRAADVLLGAGLRRLFLSLGPEGLLAADHAGRLRLKGRGQTIVNATGSGDALMAGLIWAWLEGLDLAGSARAGMAAAAAAMAGAETINPALSADRVKATMNDFEEVREEQP